MPTFLNPVGRSGTFFPPQIAPLVTTPASGNTVIMPMGSPSYIVNKTTVTAALTVRLPSSPYQGQRASITPMGAITALNVQSSSGTVVAGSPFTGVAATPITFFYLGTAWTLLV